MIPERILIILSMFMLFGCEDDGLKYTVYEKQNGSFSAHAEVKCTFVAFGSTANDAITTLKDKIDKKSPTICYDNSNVKPYSTGILK